MQDKFLKNATNRQPEVLEKRMEMSLKITSIHIMSQLGFEDTCSILLNHLGWLTHFLFELLQPKTKKSFFFFSWQEPQSYFWGFFMEKKIKYRILALETSILGQFLSGFHWHVLRRLKII